VWAGWSLRSRWLIELRLGPIALAFAAASSREDLARIRALEATHGESWPLHWLEQKGVRDAPTV
jgi:type IV secretion system protein VirB4